MGLLGKIMIVFIIIYLREYWLVSLYPRAHLLRLAYSLSSVLGRLGSGSLLIAKDADHVRSIACEVSSTELAGWQQEHDTFVEESDAHALLTVEVVNVLLELYLVCVTLGHEGNDSIPGNKSE